MLFLFSPRTDGLLLWCLARGSLGISDATDGVVTRDVSGVGDDDGDSDSDDDVSDDNAVNLSWDNVTLLPAFTACHTRNMSRLFLLLAEHLQSSGIFVCLPRAGLVVGARRQKSIQIDPTTARTRLFGIHELGSCW